MRFAKKKDELVVACRLGDGTALEKQLISDGKLRMTPDGRFEVFSLEARDGAGEIANAGDYVKVDSTGHPYPNTAAFFDANHVLLEDGGYMQIGVRREVWLDGDAVDGPVGFLLRNGLLRIDASDSERYFHAVLWGAPLSAARDAVIVIFSCERDEAGGVTDVEFGFVARDVFDSTYEWCEA